MVDEITLDALYDCWLNLMQEQGIDVPVPDEETEPQGAGFVPGYGVEGDYPVCCQHYTTKEGDEHVELCGRHAQLIEDTTLPTTEKWLSELAVLYDEWLALSPEEERAVIASSQAFFTLWLEQQTAALKKQNAEDVDARIETMLRNQCADLCHAVYALREE